mmetsp:Transcript_21271/g.58913  ORF Transcript_21271/g.58913 Transcript_21271/m.58913 type:complete len:563 (-) Transcript_21271:63-1751(-)
MPPSSSSSSSSSLSNNTNSSNDKNDHYTNMDHDGETDKDDGRKSMSLTPRRNLAMVMLAALVVAAVYWVNDASNQASYSHTLTSLSTSLSSSLPPKMPLSLSFTTLPPPLVPRLATPQSSTATTASANQTVAAHDALHKFFNVLSLVNPSTGWMELAAFRNRQGMKYRWVVTQLRSLAQTMMMGRELACGKPTVPGFSVTPSSSSSLSNPKDRNENGSEYCFWEGDLVSQKALQDFAFERPLWQFVIRQFSKKLQQQQQQQHKHQWAFLDLGVNVGDWAAPILSVLKSHPNFAYYGVEGSPPTAALAAANMVAALSDNSNAKTASAYLFPYPLLPWRLYQQASHEGGVCFSSNPGNVGGQGVPPPTAQQQQQQKSSLSSSSHNHLVQNLTCAPHLAAGAAYFPQAAQAVATTYQSSSSQSSQSTNPWPRFYIAKLDIQDFEFKALSSAVEWLQRRPPCYIIIEAYPPNSEFAPHMWALWELLLDAGYNALWRGHDMFRSGFVGEFPDADSPPYWKADAKNKTSLYQAWEKDLEGRNWWAYRDYVLGFQDEEACVERIMSTEL